MLGKKTREAEQQNSTECLSLDALGLLSDRKIRFLSFHRSSASTSSLFTRIAGFSAFIPPLQLDAQHRYRRFRIRRNAAGRFHKGTLPL